jgi:hypothetical protein
LFLKLLNATHFFDYLFAKTFLLAKNRPSHAFIGDGKQLDVGKNDKKTGG